MKRNIFLTILTFICYFTVLFFTDWRHRYTFPIFIISMYIVGFFLKNKRELFLCFVPFLTLFILVPILEGGALFYIIILYTIFLPLSLFTAFYIKNKNIIVKSIFPIAIVLFSIFGFIDYLNLTRNFDSHTNKISPEIKLITEQKDTLYLNKMNSKVIVLDFWNSTCGICFKKFPEYEKVYVEYNNNPNVVLYSVNIPYSDETVEGNMALAKKKVNYKFENLYAESSSLADSLGFNLYPHLIILKDGRIRYDGYAILNPKERVHNIRNEIDRLLEE